MKHIFLLFCSLFLICTHAQASGTMITNGLIGYWHYNQGVNGTTWNNIAPDTIGLYNGTLYGVDLSPEGMRFLDADYVDISSLPSLTQYTVELVLSVDDVGNVENYFFYTRTSNYSKYLYLYTETKEIKYNSNNTGMTSAPKRLTVNNQFYTITFAHDGRDFYYYLNGTRFTYGGPSPLPFEAIVHIGGGYNFDGVVKSVKIYNRALAASEITQNMNISPDDTGLEAPRSWSLSSPSPFVDFGTITANDQIQTVKANFGNMPVEHMGTNPDGWKVSVTASPFSQVNGGSLTLPANTLKLNGIQSITTVSGSSSLPAVISGPWIIDQGAVDILHAPMGSGEGEYEIVFPPDALELSIDTSNVVVDSLNNPTRYRSTITWSMSVGP